ncbi:MAG: hypothetical protein M1835_000613 [Candelina submexicana]|nr:MAG: hypothetical protein M1835_000613 [Candelina submexicana]
MSQITSLSTKPLDETKPTNDRILKITIMSHRHPSLTEKEFHDYWSAKHAKLAAPWLARNKIIKYTQYHTPSELRGLAGPMASKGDIKIADYDGHVEFLVREFDFLEQALRDPEYHLRISDDERKFIDVERSVVTVGYVEDYVVDGKVVETLGSNDVEWKKEAISAVINKDMERGYSRGIVVKGDEAFIKEGQALRREKARMKGEKKAREKVVRKLYSGDDTSGGEQMSSGSQTSVEDGGEKSETDRTSIEEIVNHPIGGREDGGAEAVGLFRPVRTRAIQSSELDKNLIKGNVEDGDKTARRAPDLVDGWLRLN